DWGDGFPVDPATFTPAPDGSLMVTGSHRYWDLGDHTVSVQIAEPASGTEVSVTSTATVLPPVLAATGVTLETTEGSPLGTSVVATFTDTAADPGPFQVSIDWADNTPLDTTGTVTGSDGNYSVVADHTFAVDGSYVVLIHITDSTGNTDTVTSTIQVDD